LPTRRAIPMKAVPTNPDDFVELTHQFSTTEEGLLIKYGFSIQRTGSHDWVVIGFNFEGHRVSVHGRIEEVEEFIHRQYEEDVFDVGFDFIRGYPTVSGVRRYVQTNYLITGTTHTC
jgi:hypothetical protein